MRDMLCQMLTVSLCVHSASWVVIDDAGPVLYPTCEFLPPSGLKIAIYGACP